MKPCLFPYQETNSKTLVVRLSHPLQRRQNNELEIDQFDAPKCGSFDAVCREHHELMTGLYH